MATTLTSAQARRDPESREWWQGWWESTVCWLELPEHEGEELVQVERVFYSDAERVAYLKGRVDGGWVYDILWTTETTLGGKGHPDVPVYTEEEWEVMMGEVGVTSRTVGENEILVV